MARKIPPVLRKAVLASCRYERELVSSKSTGKRRERLMRAMKDAVLDAQEKLGYVNSREVHEDISRHRDLCRRAR